MTDEQLQSLFAGTERNLEKRIQDAKDELNESLDKKLSALQTRIDAKIERVETSLLTEFQKWASPTDARLRTHTATLRALDLEMEALTDRVQKLEGGAS
jgi:hypothetical protein